MSDRLDPKVLKWSGHVDRMSGERMTKRMYESGVKGRRIEAGQERGGWTES